MEILKFLRDLKKWEWSSAEKESWKVSFHKSRARASLSLLCQSMWWKVISLPHSSWQKKKRERMKFLHTSTEWLCYHFEKGARKCFLVETKYHNLSSLLSVARGTLAHFSLSSVYIGMSTIDGSSKIINYDSSVIMFTIKKREGFWFSHPRPSCNPLSSGREFFARDWMLTHIFILFFLHSCAWR